MLEPIFPLILFAIVATTTPGIATTLSTASGAQFGFRRSVPLLVGSAAGLATVTGAAAAGLAGLLLAVPSLQLAMKVTGSLYLVWLA
ncbi:LysE family translocator, partial [Mesorhizobium sp. M7A.F.Ca.CA.002.03.1.1]